MFRCELLGATPVGDRQRRVARGRGHRGGRGRRGRLGHARGRRRRSWAPRRAEARASPGTLPLAPGRVGRAGRRPPGCAASGSGRVPRRPRVDAGAVVVAHVSDAELDESVVQRAVLAPDVVLEVVAPCAYRAGRAGRCRCAARAASARAGWRPGRAGCADANGRDRWREAPTRRPGSDSRSRCGERRRVHHAAVAGGGLEGAGMPRGVLERAEAAHVSPATAREPVGRTPRPPTAATRRTRRSRTAAARRRRRCGDRCTSPRCRRRASRRSAGSRAVSRSARPLSTQER